MKRVLLTLFGLIVSIIGATALFIYYKEYVVGGIISVLIVFFLWKLVRMFVHSENDLAIVLEAVRNGDTTLRFNNSVYPGKVGDKLNRITDVLHSTRLDLARNQKYYEYLLNEVPGGVLVTDTFRKVLTVNQSCLRLLKMQALGSMERIKEYFPEAAKTILELKNGEKSTVTIHDKTVSVSCSLIYIPERGELFIYVFTDIDSELSKKETESWTMSVRTLSHEIINAVTPIISISNTLSVIPLNEENSEDIREGMKSISVMGETLRQFAKSYRTLSHTPCPVLTEENPEDIIREIITAMRHLEETSNINFEYPTQWYPIKCDRNLTFTAFSNIIKNAVESLKDQENGLIRINCEHTDNGFVRVNIGNNGPQIPKSITQEIFSPFFTTKSGGQGIGLPLSKRIMVSQGGNLTLFSYKDSSTLTTFSFLFRS